MYLIRCARLALALVLTATVSCASLPDNSGKPESLAISKPVTTALGEALAGIAVTHPANQSGFYLLPNGHDAFVARAALAQIAQHSIDSQYYMVHGDLVGSLYLHQLLKAADRGVKVRFLLDDIDEGHRDFELSQLDFHPNIEVRIFNPFGRNTGKTMQFVTGLGKQTRRSHNKSFTVDNTATILGGRNIGDEYFDADINLAFADLDVMGAGPVAREVSASFDQYWNNSLSYPIQLLSNEQATEADYRAGREKLDAFVAKQSESAYIEHLTHSALANEIRDKRFSLQWANSKVYADPPEKLTVKTGERDYQMLPLLKPYIDAAKEELIIFSPYFVPGKEGTRALIKLRERGVRVRILTNSLASTDVSIVHAGYMRYRKDLLRGGIELYELNQKTKKGDRKAYKKGSIGASRSSLHAKSFVVDRENIFIGSLNLDPRSIEQNTEIGVVIQSKELSLVVANGFDSEIDRVAFKLELDDRGKLTWIEQIDGKNQVLTKEPYTSFWRRFTVGFMRLMPIESQI